MNWGSQRNNTITEKDYGKSILTKKSFYYMQEISAKIIRQKIVESNIFVSRDMEDKIDINMMCKVNLKMPKNPEEKSVLLEMHLKINAMELLKIELTADVFLNWSSY